MIPGVLPYGAKTTSEILESSLSVASTAISTTSIDKHQRLHGDGLWIGFDSLNEKVADRAVVNRNMS